MNKYTFVNSNKNKGTDCVIILDALKIGIKN